MAEVIVNKIVALARRWNGSRRARHRIKAGRTGELRLRNIPPLVYDAAGRFRRFCLNHTSLTFFKGRLRTGLPVAAWIALRTAGETTEMVGSPIPPQKS